MKNVIKVMMLLTALISIAAHADQVPTMICKGANIILEERSPYLGEDSKAAQSLFVLKAIDNDNESKYTAFFLNFGITDISGPKNGKYGGYTTYAAASNEKGGKLELILSAWTDESDEISTKKTATGDLTYKHGPLKGKSVPVVCVIQ